VTAVLLNILFNMGKPRRKEAAIFAESPPVGVTPEHDVPGGIDNVPGAVDTDDRASDAAWVTQQARNLLMDAEHRVDRLKSVPLLRAGNDDRVSAAA
jgi:hypothetical protein